MTDKVAYFDHASTSPVRKSVVKAMKPFFRDKFGNASSPYAHGREARAAVDEARDRIAGALGADSREIIFASGGTESIILGILGAAIGNRHRGNHIITTAFEHHAVSAVFDFLGNEMGFDTEIAGVNSEGMVLLDELGSKLRDDTVLVSVMAVNNEVGTIQRIEDVIELCRPEGTIVHSDAVQAVGKIPLDFHEMDLDLGSASAHKFGGPKGVGFIYVKAGTYLKPICEGSHEFGIRSGTENVAGIVGMAVAVEEAVKELPRLGKKLSGFGERIWDCIKSCSPDAQINGSADNRVPAILNVHLPGCEGEMLVLALDRVGVEASMGSACTTGSIDASHVLRAMGLRKSEALSSLRISMGYSTTKAEVDHFLDVFPNVYERVLSASVV